MIAPDALKAHLADAFPDSHIEIFDMNGMQDHYTVYIRSQAFAGKLLMAQHRQVKQALQPLMDSGVLHAAEIKTDAPESSQV
jgi:stress-induced morphogen